MCGGSFMGTVPNQIGSALGGGTNPLQSGGIGGGLMGGAMPAPMQNPFTTTQVSRPPESFGPQYGGGMGQPMTPQVSRPLTDVPQYGGGMGQPMPLQVSRPPVDVPQYGGGMGQPMPLQVSRPPVNVPQRKFAGAMPSIKEFRDATGADFKTAADLLYGVAGSSKDTRDWQKIFSSPDPIAAARQATAAMYGGVKQGTYTDPVTGKQNTMLMSGTGIPLTTPGSRDVNFGVGLTPNSGANFVSGLATNARFPGAGAQQIQGQMPLQNPPTMGAGSGTSQPMTTQDLIARLSGLLGLQGGGMGQPYISDRGYFGPGTIDNPTGPQFGQEGVITSVNRPLTDVPQYGGQGAVNTQVGRNPATFDPRYGGGMGRLFPPQVSRQPDFFGRRYGGGMGAGIGSIGIANLIPGMAF